MRPDRLIRQPPKSDKEINLRTIHKTVALAADPERVFAFVSNPENFPEFVAGLESTHITSERPSNGRLGRIRGGSAGSVGPAPSPLKRRRHCH